MTPRQRVLASLNHQQPDRVPIDFSGHRSSGIAAIAYAKLRKALGFPEKPIRVYDPIQQLAIVDDDVLDRFQIVGKKDLYPNQLSGGQQQLVGVARAVIANPQVILADEPTGNLHSAQGKEIMDLFRTLNEAGTTILQVTHSEVNASYGTRIINLRDGWIVGD